MINRLVKLIEKEINDEKYLINYEKINSKELFFIKDKLDMNRAKTVEHCTITLYKEITEGKNKYLGSAELKISPGMSDEEIVEGIKTTIYSATLVKNPSYKLVKPTEKKAPQIKSNISYENGAETIKKVIDLVYRIEKENTAKVNSMEIFLEEIEKKVVNSEGVNETFMTPGLIIELVVDCKGEKEEVELYDMIKVSSYDEQILKEKIAADFINVERRAAAKELSGTKDIPVLLKGEAVCEIFSYYTFKSDTASVYKKLSQMKPGDNVQGDEVKGDSISITLMPEIPFSINSRYIDGSGIVMEEMNILREGKLLALHGSNRYSQYCDVEPTGNIPNVKVHSGNSEYGDMIKGECLEVISFSDFQMDGITGDFGGEIRLAIYHKDSKASPVTGGSITGNIAEVHGNIELSKQTEITGNYQHPKAIKIKGVNISS